MDQSDFPPEWQCTTDDKRVQVEILVRDMEITRPQGGSSIYEEERVWIEIPTMSVEQWVEKGDASEVQRTAKVEFPMEWGEDSDDVKHNSPRQLIETASEQSDNSVSFARIWWQQNGGDWKLGHHGWVGGVGSADGETTGKFWVYDFAELLGTVPIGTSFNDPSFRQALEEVAKLTNDNSFVPLSDVVYIPPEAEEVFGQTGVPDDVGLSSEDGEATSATESESALNGNYHVYETLNDETTPLSEEEIDFGYGIEVLSPGTTYDASATVDTDQGDAESRFGAVGEAIGGDVTGAIGTAINPDDETQAKKFEPNHDTLLDVYEWLGEKVDGNLHFDPRPNSVVLVADMRTSRRVFAQSSVVDHAVENDDFVPPSLFGTDVVDGSEQDEMPYIWHENVTVLKNDALFEMKPLNTFKLRGETAKALLRVDQSDLESGSGFLESINVDPSMSKAFPVIELQIPPLVEAAEGHKLEELVESDATSLDGAEREAEKKFSERLAETTEGEIVLSGEPTVVPFDRVDSFEVCNERTEFQQVPVSYEVESVTHVKKSGERYKTFLNVSIWANDKTMETVRKELVDA